MARLNQSADFSHATPITSQATDAMSSPAPRSLAFEASLQSHGADNLPHSPLRRSSGCASFSPADCPTLGRLLCNTNVSSPPQTLSSFEQGEPLLSDSPCSDSFSSDRTKEAVSYYVAGVETTDAGYEDEDDSTELSDSTEVATASAKLALLHDPISPSISKSDCRLQESVSIHEEKDRRRYNGRQSSISKSSKVERCEKSNTKANADTGGNTLEEVSNSPGKRDAAPRRLHVIHDDFDCQPESVDVVKPLGSLHLSLDEVRMRLRVEQERAGLQDTSNITALRSLMVLGGTEEVNQFGFDEFDADKEDTTTVMMRAQRRKNSKSRASKPVLQASPGIGLSQGEEQARSLMPMISVAATHPPNPAHVEFTPYQNAPETPLAKTLSYFKEFKESENAQSERHRNIGLSKETIEVSKTAVDEKDGKVSPDQEQSSPTATDISNLPTTSALAHLEELTDSVDPSFVDKADKSREVTASSYHLLEEPAGQSGIDGEHAEEETEKRLIYYPQHPAFVNAIGMIPATMFWVTAAPIVRYTSMAVEMLVDKLRETYL
ncbi:hypothetical protein SVAN01_02342 [Stagonosporopsis vannaccii]|nr:hypothetical protein SVAN01_02342 [Stagonosporopsis vannaccii]